MKILISKRMIWTMVFGLGISILIGLCCALFVHGLGNLLRSVGDMAGLGQDTETYAVIFEQLREAEVDLPAVLTLVLSVLCSGGLRRIVCGKDGKEISKRSHMVRVCAVILLGMLGFILVWLITLWFTDVNGIRFGTVIWFLYNALQHGVF